MELNRINFIKGNGGMARSAASEDPISGLIFAGFSQTYGSSAGNLSGFDADNAHSTCHMRKFEYAEQCEEAGIVHTDYDGTTALTSDQKEKNALYYHINEFFRMNPKGTLYVMIMDGANGAITPEYLSMLQQYANGTIRQCGLFNGEFGTTLTIAGLQTELTALEAAHMPMSVVVTYLAPAILPPAFFTAELKTAGKCNVSVLVGCDYTPTLVAELGDFADYGCIGTCIGAISKAAVHESIAWVQKFPLGFTEPSLFNGMLVKNLTKAEKEQLNNNYIFVTTHVGDADCYFNDSHTLDVATSDYAYIENVRTIDKACRGVHANLLPYLNSPIKVDATDGTLDRSTVAVLETEAGKALEDMEKAGELSGYSVEIDPDQNVLSTSTVEVVIKNVPMGVMRKVNVKIGFVTSI